MGYTHYWNQRRDFTRAEWRQVCVDIGAILKHVQHELNIPLANGGGDPGTQPEIDAAAIIFNGLGDNAHETFIVNRVRPAKEEWQSKRGDDFCKTARKPYDLAVTASLCYLSTITRDHDRATGEPVVGTEIYSVSTDGDGPDFLAGLQCARDALPRYGNELDIPMAVMESDRWCVPWVNRHRSKGYAVHFCVDGYGYVLKQATGESYRFPSHVELASFLDKHKRLTFSSGGRFRIGGNEASYGATEPDIWNASGCFDERRHDRIAKAQAKVLASLFPVDPEHAHQPPAFVRPGEFPSPREWYETHGVYFVRDLLKSAEAA